MILFKKGVFNHIVSLITSWSKWHCSSHQRNDNQRTMLGPHALSLKVTLYDIAELFCYGITSPSLNILVGETWGGHIVDAWHVWNPEKGTDVHILIVFSWRIHACLPNWVWLWGDCCALQCGEEKSRLGKALSGGLRKTVDTLHLGEEGPFEKKADVLTVPLSAHITLASPRLGEVGDIQTGKLSRNKT